MERAVAVAVVVCGVIGALAGCGTQNGGGNGWGGGNPMGGDASAPGADATPGDDAGSLIGDASGDGASCGVHCSSDLHDVLDCNGHLVKSCPTDQGCAPGGACVPACDSANANKSTFGCEYYAVDPDIIPVVQGACFATFVANTWGSPVTIQAEWNGMQLDVAGAARIPQGTGQSLTYQPLPNGTLPPGQVAILFLDRFGVGESTAPAFDCPTGITPAITSQDAALHGTGIGNAFHMTTDRPVAAYDIYPYGGGQTAATSATLLVPTSA